MFVKIRKYIGFWVYRRSYLLKSPVIAQFPEILPAVTKQAETKKGHVSMGKNKQARDTSSPHGSIIPVRKGTGTINTELWYTTPYHLQPNDTRNISAVACAHSKKNKRKNNEEKHEAEGTERRKK